MKITTQFKSLVTAGFTIFLLSGCSSGSTATGLGLGVGGTWFGELLRNSVVFASFTMSLSQSPNTPEDPFSPSALTGTFNSNNECIGGGTLEGTLNANSITLTASTPNGTLTMSGNADNNSMEGTWINEGSLTGTEEDAVAESCNFGGVWRAGR